jgi:hypothetical protein
MFLRDDIKTGSILAAVSLVASSVRRAMDHRLHVTGRLLAGLVASMELAGVLRLAEVVDALETALVLALFCLLLITSVVLHMAVALRGRGLTLLMPLKDVLYVHVGHEDWLRWSNTTHWLSSVQEECSVAPSTT